MKIKSHFKKRPGEGTPLTIAIVLVLVMLFCLISEFARLWIIAQGIKEATQDAILSVVNDNYNDVYHAVREGYAAGWYPTDTGWDESLDTGNVYGHLKSTLGLTRSGDEYVKYADGEQEYMLSGLTISVRNNGFASGVSRDYTATAEIAVEIPMRFLGSILPPVQLKLHAAATYMPLF